MKLERLIVSCLLIVVAVTTAPAATFFVDAGRGSDSNSGTAAAKPFLTIQKAIQAAAERRGPDMIQIAKGRYTENLVIGDPHSVTLSGTWGVEIVAASSSAEVIYVKLGDVTISDVKVSGGKHGIRGAGSADAPVYLTLRGVDSVDNAERGLRAVDVLDVSISGCQFLRNGTDGIKVQTDTLDRTWVNLSVSDTIISGSGDDGIDLETLNDVSLVNVVVQDTIGDDGLSIDDTVSISIVNCVFVNSNADGIDIDDVESVSIVSTVSMANGVGGLQVKAEGDYDVESIRIVNSEFLDNGADGVWICEEGTVVKRASLNSVTAIGNAGSGLNIAITGTLKLSAITSEGNGLPDVP